MTYLALTQSVQGVVYYCYHVYTRDAAKARQEVALRAGRPAGPA